MTTLGYSILKLRICDLISVFTFLFKQNATLKTTSLSITYKKEQNK